MSGVSKLFARSGREASKMFLRSVAKLLIRVCRDGDKVCRIGDCTFGIVLDGVDSPILQQLAAEKIIRLYKAAISEMDVPFNAGISIGIATYPEHADNAVDLIHNAEIALEGASAAGDPYFIYSPDSLSTMSLKWTLQDDLSTAIENKAFELVYQPKISLATGRPLGAEALLRWNHEDHGSVPPSVFVPLACEIGMINELTSFVLMTALGHASEWPHVGERCSVSVNIEAEMLDDAEFDEVIASSLSIWGDDSVDLIIEITETALVADFKSSFDHLKKLRSMGIGVSVDDFGTGYSSLSYFKNIPATELKVDKSFISNMLHSSRNRSLVETIISLAHGFDLTVVAEGVERAEEARMLADMKCDAVQGFYFSEPLQHAEFCRWLAEYDSGNESTTSIGSL
jgi:EAL domain-containing protein (putative c-di-GMP-specific phosphodiesterase class I)